MKHILIAIFGLFILSSTAVQAQSSQESSSDVKLERAEDGTYINANQVNVKAQPAVKAVTNPKASDPNYIRAEDGTYITIGEAEKIAAANRARKNVPVSNDPTIERAEDGTPIQKTDNTPK